MNDALDYLNSATPQESVDRVTQFLQQKAASIPRNEPPPPGYEQMYNPALMQSMQQPDQLGMLNQAIDSGHPVANALQNKVSLVVGNDPSAQNAAKQFIIDHPNEIDPANSYQVMTALAQFMKQMPSNQETSIEDLGNIASGKGTNFFGVRGQSQNDLINQNLKLAEAQKYAAQAANGGGRNNTAFAMAMQQINADPELSKLPLQTRMLIARGKMSEDTQFDPNTGEQIVNPGAEIARGKLAYAEKNQGKTGELNAQIGLEPQLRGENTAAENRAKVNVEREAGMTKAQSALLGFKQQAQLVSNTIDSAIKTMDDNPNTSVGYGSYLSGLPNSSAGELSGYLDTIKANIGFDKLQSMRESSPTGGALGQISDFEDKLLQAVNGALNPKQPAQMRKNLLIIKQLYPKVLAERTRAFQQDYGNVSPIGNNPVSQQKTGGVLHVDAKGNKAIVYPDGSYEEVQ